MNINGQASLRPIYKTFFLILHIWMFCLYVISIYHLNPWILGAREDRRGHLLPWSGGKMFVGYHMYSRIKSWSWMWADSALNKEAISLAFEPYVHSVWLWNVSWSHIYYRQMMVPFYIPTIIVHSIHCCFLHSPTELHLLFQWYPS